MRKIQLTCLTPLWTGDIDSKSNVLQSTGFMGSLRWWTEAILRGMGKFACDPTEEWRCPQKGESSRIEEFCCSCLIFGATGLRRLFRIEFEGGNRLFTGGALNIRPNGRNRGWYLGSGIVGNISSKIVTLDNVFDENLIILPLVIASKWGGFGAKTQLGYGVIKIENIPEIDIAKFENAIKKITDETRLSTLKIKLRNDANPGLPDIKEMFFAKVQFEVRNNNWWQEVDGIKKDTSKRYEGYINDQRMIRWIQSESVPVAPAIKNWHRFGNGKKLWYTTNADNNIERWLFGSLRDERISSKINISCAYRVNNNIWEIRIWGWIPKNNNPEGFDRESFLNNLKQALTGSGSVTIPWSDLLGSQTSNHKLTVWREYNSSRDTIKPNESDIENFIRSLI